MRIQISHEEAFSCPAYNEVLSNLRRSKSKQRSMNRTKLSWFFDVYEFISLGVSSVPWEEAAEARISKIHKIVLVCRPPGKGAKNYESSPLNYTPYQVRVAIRAKEMYRT